MKVGQRIRIAGEKGTILQVTKQDVLLRMDNPDEGGVTDYWESQRQVQLMTSPDPEPEADLAQMPVKDRIP